MFLSKFHIWFDFSTSNFKKQFDVLIFAIDHSLPCLSIQTWYNGAKERDTMSPIEVPAKIQLVEKRETRTSRGMLSKGWYHVDDQLVMVKGNSITEAGTAGYEPYSEVMASLIAQVLNLPHVEYTLMPDSSDLRCSQRLPQVHNGRWTTVSFCRLGWCPFSCRRSGILTGSIVPVCDRTIW